MIASARRRSVLIVALSLSALALTIWFLGCGGEFCTSATIVDNLSHPRPSERQKRSWRYSLGQAILPVIHPEDTQYASGYAEKAFASLKIGTSQSDVRTVLGEPLSTQLFSDRHTVWYYSQPGHKSKNYFVRALEFGQDGNLVQRHAEFYLD
jgi:hypothetical protein